jgi:hypothetical protein
VSELTEDVLRAFREWGRMLGATYTGLVSSGVPSSAAVAVVVEIAKVRTKDDASPAGFKWQKPGVEA